MCPPASDALERGLLKLAEKKTKGKIPGQGQPIDASTDLFWRDNKNFAEVFSKAVFNGLFINPDQLEDLNVAESTMLRMKDGATTTLKQTRDVVKSLTSDGAWLVILGIENQTHIDFLMPFRVWELNFINVARQVEEIRKAHRAERKAAREAEARGEIIEERALSPSEVLSGFYRDDRLNPVITLVIYYGQEEWKKPLRLSDLFKESPFTGFADDMPMYLLDVRHMTKAKIDSYSPDLRSFFGFLKYENTIDLDEFVMENTDSFSNLPEQTIDALIEITHSKELERFKKEYKTPEGGVNVCYGIQVYGNQREMAGSVRIAQRHGFSIAETVRDIMAEYQLQEKDAKDVVEKNWKKNRENASEMK